MGILKQNTRTYGKNKVSYDRKKEIKVAKTRREAPKFEDLFCKLNVFNSSGEISKSPEIPPNRRKEDKPRNIIFSDEPSHENDSFDNLLMNCERVLPLKENSRNINVFQNESSNSSLKSTPNRSFLSTEIIIDIKSRLKVKRKPGRKKPKLRCKENIPEISKVPVVCELPNPDSSLTSTPPEKCEPSKSRLDSLGPSVVTSTPACRDASSRSTRRDQMMLTQLSPVPKDSSYCESMNSSKYVSCSSQFSSIRIVKESNDLEDISTNLKVDGSHPEAKECFMNLQNHRHHSLHKSTSSLFSQSIRNSLSVHNNDSRGFLLYSNDQLRKTISNSFLSRSSFNHFEIESRRRRRNVIVNFRNASKIVNFYPSSMRNKSFSSTSDLKPCGYAGNSFALSRSSLRDSCTENSSASFVMSKPGKGWRKSIKKSFTAQMQKSLDLFNDTAFKNDNSLGGRGQASRTSMLEVLDQDLSKSPLKSEDFRTNVLKLCDQQEELPLTDCFTETVLRNCKKIGEGVYGEVFMTFNEGTSRRVLKMMPIEGDFPVNGEPQKTFEEMIPEIVVSLELSKLEDRNKESSCSNYVKVYNVWCLQGSYSTKLLELWDCYHEEKDSENDRPDIFPETQLYIVLEFGFAGIDLEKFVFNNAMQAHSALMQVALGLAVAELELEFEHRDLHWGNVLVTPITDLSLQYKINGNSICIKSLGVQITIIDFTLSRLRIDGRTFFNDLSKDPTLFQAMGDYQFEVYRLMQNANSNNWQRFEPLTNIYWLHYICLKMISGVYYKNEKTKIHKNGMAKLRLLEKQMLSHSSALAFVQSTVEELELA